MMPTEIIRELIERYGYVVESKYAVYPERTAWLTLSNDDCKVTFKAVYDTVCDLEKDICFRDQDIQQ